MDDDNIWGEATIRALFGAGWFVLIHPTIVFVAVGALAALVLAAWLIGSALHRDEILQRRAEKQAAREARASQPWFTM